MQQYRPQVLAPSPALVVGRPKEEEAGRVAAAQEAAKLAYLPQAEAIKANAAVGQALGISGGQQDLERKNKLLTRAMDGQGVLSLLDEAEAILPKATGSTLGAYRDKAAAAVGQSTEGAQATAQLQTIAGQLTAKQPRFEGPQGVRDVELYQQMAGDLANPSLPVETRQAALRTIRSLNLKYAAPANRMAIKPKPKRSMDRKPQRLRWNPATQDFE